MKMIQYLASPEKYQNSHGKENEIFGALARTYFSIWDCFPFDLQSGVGRKWPPGSKAPSTCSRSCRPARLRQGGSCPGSQCPARAHDPSACPGRRVRFSCCRRGCPRPVRVRGLAQGQAGSERGLQPGSACSALRLHPRLGLRRGGAFRWDTRPAVRPVTNTQTRGPNPALLVSLSSSLSLSPGPSDLSPLPLPPSALFHGIYIHMTGCVVILASSLASCGSWSRNTL